MRIAFCASVLVMTPAFAQDGEYACSDEMFRRVLERDNPFAAPTDAEIAEAKAALARAKAAEAEARRVKTREELREEMKRCPPSGVCLDKPVWKLGSETLKAQYRVWDLEKARQEAPARAARKAACDAFLNKHRKGRKLSDEAVWKEFQDEQRAANEKRRRERAAAYVGTPAGGDLEYRLDDLEQENADLEDANRDLEDRLDSAERRSRELEGRLNDLEDPR